jgi:hypothetical protein
MLHTAAQRVSLWCVGQYPSSAWPQVLERPKVIYNEGTGKWVMWMHVDE